MTVIVSSSAPTESCASTVAVNWAATRTPRGGACETGQNKRHRVKTRPQIDNTVDALTIGDGHTDSQ